MRLMKYIMRYKYTIEYKCNKEKGYMKSKKCKKYKIYLIELKYKRYMLELN